MKKYLVILPLLFLVTWYVAEISPGLAWFVWGMVGLFKGIEYLARNDKKDP